MACSSSTLAVFLAVTPYRMVTLPTVYFSLKTQNYARHSGCLATTPLSPPYLPLTHFLDLVYSLCHSRAVVRTICCVIACPAPLLILLRTTVLLTLLPHHHFTRAACSLAPHEKKKSAEDAGRNSAQRPTTAQRSRGGWSAQLSPPFIPDRYIYKYLVIPGIIYVFVEMDGSIRLAPPPPFPLRYS